MAWFKKKVDSDKGVRLSSVADHDGVDARWIKAGAAHDDRFLRLAAQAANWRTFAFISLFIASIAVSGAIYIGAQSKYVPMLVEVDKLGRTLAVRALTGDDAVTDSKRLVYRELFDLVENLRTVTTDIAANKTNLNRGFSRLTGAAAEYVRTELRKAPPNEVGASKTVQVDVKTALRISDNTWQVEWEEHSFDLKGAVIGVENWKATIGFKLTPMETEEAIRKNPIGFIVPELNWMKVI